MNVAASLLWIGLGWDWAGPAVSLSAQTAPAPRPCAARDNGFLRSLVGDWKVQAEFRSGENAWEEAAGHARIEAELGGCVVVARYEGTRFGEPFAFLTVLGANGSEEPIQELFVHSQHGVMALSSGRVDGGTLTVEDRPTVGGKVVRIQHVYAPGPSGFRYESRRSTDGGRSWTVVWKANYTQEGREPVAP